jgi:DNA-binding NarL/FixJ family response regulator
VLFRSNHNGRWSPELAELAITVLPPWWRKPELLPLAAALLLLAALLGLHGWRAYKRRLTRTLAEVPEDVEATLGKYELTPRELEVLRLVLRGRSNKEIENALFISLSTVKAHIGSVYRKLGVNSRLQLINFIASRQSRKPD